MWTQPQRVLRLRLELLDTARSVERIVEVDADSRLESLHGLITAVFSWSGRDRHIFTDRRTVTAPHSWGTGRQRVWEMEHLCRDREHVSECEWTATIGAVLDPGRGEARDVSLFYEYGVGIDCSARDYGSGCLLDDLGVCEYGQAHGWTVAIELIEQRKAPRGERLPTLLDGCGRAPLEETGSPDGDAVLNEVLDDPAHSRHAELDAWTRGLVGPWARASSRAFDPDRFESGIVAQALDLAPKMLEATLPARLVSAASAASSRHRLDVLTAAARLGFEQGAAVDAATANRLTGELVGWLRQIAEATAEDSDPGERLLGVDTDFARSLRLIWRRGGKWRVTRLGEGVAGDPESLLAHCADGYWRAAGHPAIGVYVLLGVANGIAGEELTDLVLAARAADRSTTPDWEDEWGVTYRFGSRMSDDDPDPAHVERCTAYLARFGAFTVEADHRVVTADGVALAMSFLTR